MEKKKVTKTIVKPVPKKGMPFSAPDRIKQIKGINKRNKAIMDELDKS